jgi:short-subunit dehydrogenase
MSLISFTTPLINSARLQTKFGKASYVLITGSSDGIGKAYAKFFAKNGFNLILWSRTLSKLESLKEELTKKHKDIDIKLIASDFSYSSKSGYFSEHLESLKDLDISIVVNNVGYLTVKKELGLFNVKELVRSINVNLVPQAVLTGHFMKVFQDRPSNVCSAFIDLSSVSSFLPLIKQHIYASTKHFNAYFSRSVDNLYRSKSNIICQLVRPGPVDTEMFDKVIVSMKEEKGKGFHFPGFLIVKVDETVIGTVRAMTQNIFDTGGSIKHSIANSIIWFLMKVSGFYYDLIMTIKNLRR